MSSGPKIFVALEKKKVNAAGNMILAWVGNEMETWTALFFQMVVLFVLNPFGVSFAFLFELLKL